MKTKTIKANELKVGDMIDGYDKVTQIVKEFGFIRVYSLCNVVSYRPTNSIEIA